MKKVDGGLYMKNFGQIYIFLQGTMNGRQEAF